MLDGVTEPPLFDVFSRLCFAWAELCHSSQRVTTSHLKKQFHLKSQFPPEMTLRKVSAKLSVPPKIKWPVQFHVEYMLQKVFKMTGVKLTRGTHLPIGIYWYQSTQKVYFHLFIHSQKHGLTMGLMIKPLLWECICKLENYI